jgi:hypothetical protein
VTGGFSRQWCLGWRGRVSTIRAGPVAYCNQAARPAAGERAAGAVAREDRHGAAEADDPYVGGAPRRLDVTVRVTAEAFRGSRGPS